MCWSAITFVRNLSYGKYIEINNKVKETHRYTLRVKCMVLYDKASHNLVINVLKG